MLANFVGEVGGGAGEEINTAPKEHEYTETETTELGLDESAVNGLLGWGMYGTLGTFAYFHYADIYYN